MPGAAFADQGLCIADVNRTFFVVNADDLMVTRLREFADRWGERNGTLVAPLEESAGGRGGRMPAEPEPLNQGDGHALRPFESLAGRVEAFIKQ